MLIVGINLGETRSGKILKDGGSCLISDGEIITALAEERVSKNKHGGGYRASLHYCLHKLGLSVEDVDSFVVSSCCEGLRSLYSDSVAGIPSYKVKFLTHHLSHAYSAFAVSPFARALIVVADGGGNVLQGEGSNWWEFPREQSSYYIGENNSIELIGRDFDKPFDAGLGEIYRYLTHHLGWSTAYAGKAMALAALGDPDRYKDLVIVRFHAETGKLFSNVKNTPLDRDTFSRFLKDNGYETAIPRNYEDEVLDVHKDLARHIQDQVSQAFLEKISHLSRKTGIRDLCLAGGVALNCIINQRILDETPIENLFVQPAASDQGQSIGNAIYGSIAVGDWKKYDRFYSPYLGPEHDWDSEIKNLDKRLINEFKVSHYQDIDELIISVAKMLSNGKIVGWVQGRSESGPRALGNRSILANPYLPSTKERLNAIKKREWFMPVAPSVLMERQRFLFQGEIPSPYMLRALMVSPDVRSSIPAVVHYDNTSRIQSVSKEQNAVFYKLLSAFGRIEMREPILANTSYNPNGKPIVEDAHDAIMAGLDLGLDVIVIGNWMFDHY